MFPKEDKYVHFMEGYYIGMPLELMKRSTCMRFWFKNATANKDKVTCPECLELDKLDKEWRALPYAAYGTPEWYTWEMQMMDYSLRMRRIYMKNIIFERDYELACMSAGENLTDNTKRVLMNPANHHLLGK